MIPSVASPSKASKDVDAKAKNITAFKIRAVQTIADHFAISKKKLVYVFKTKVRDSQISYL